MTKFTKFFLPLFAIAVLGSVFLVERLSGIERQLKLQISDFNQRAAILENRLFKLEEYLGVVAKKADEKSIIKEEIVRREIIREKSQEELLTAAVAKIAPAVVSIVVTKDVPKLEIVYVNPFGDDPFFKNFDIKIPVYQQKGTEIQKVGAGTGFLINSNGYIVTNRHVVEDTAAQYTVLLSQGSQQVAQVVYKDPNVDAAILKIPGSGYSTVDLGSSDELKLGQAVFAVGNALGEYNNSVSVGVISGLNRTIEAAGQFGTERLTGVIQTDAAINPGNSGGPLVDLQGKVVGVNVATVAGSQSIGFSLPINTIKNIIQSVLK